MRRVYDPRKFADLANDLLVDGKYERESRARTAIGRAYYAAFLIAHRKLQEQGLRIPETGKIHQIVIQTFIEKGLSMIGNPLDQLREKRVDADYHMDSSITVSLGKRCAKLSEYVIQLIEEIRDLRR